MTEPIRHLYLHVPFCARICPYCAFYVHRGGVQDQRAFVDALVAEAALAREAFPFDLDTVFLGGGTPSLLPPDLFAPLMAALPPRRPGAEVTLETNPMTVTPERAAAWREAEINRVSLGVQSLDAAFLKVLGRDHTPEIAERSVALLREAGFDNVNIDLMFALPGQPTEGFAATLQRALALRPDHVSAYALTYEEDTPFLDKLNRGELKRDEEAEIAMFEETAAALAEAGLPFYEVSNYARPGFESRHNRAYWRGADYLGLGPSAVSTVGAARWTNVKDTARHAAEVAAGRLPIGEREDLPPGTRKKERIMFGLRTREGIEKELLSDSAAAVAEATGEGLAEWKDDRLVLTRRGRLLADSVAGLFV